MLATTSKLFKNSSSCGNEFTSNFFFIQEFADNAETGIDERGIHLFTPKIYEQY